MTYTPLKWSDMVPDHALNPSKTQKFSLPNEVVVPAMESPTGLPAEVKVVQSSNDAPKIDVVLGESAKRRSDKEMIEQLASRSDFEYARVRKETARLMGVPVAALDAQVAKRRKSSNEISNMPFPEVTCATNPRVPAELFDEMGDAIRRYVVLEPEQVTAIVLWIVLTWLVDAVDVVAILIINAPERACAKTLLQTLVGCMSYRPLFAANATLSALMRATEKWGCTINLDEADAFIREHPEIHGIINAGYKRGGCVIRSEAVGDGFDVRTFPVFGAKSIAGISLEKHLKDATLSRGILIGMRRKLRHENVERLRSAPVGLFDRLASEIARFAEDHREKIRNARPELPVELNDRAQDNWEALLAIAGCAGPAWVERATTAALKLSSVGNPAVSTSNELLADIREIFERKRVSKISTADLIDGLTADDEKRWTQYYRGKPITANQLAKQLGIYGIHSKTVRFGQMTPKGFERSQFEDAFSRYLTTQPIELDPSVMASDADPDAENFDPPVTSID